MMEYATAAEIGVALSRKRTAILNQAAREGWPYEERTVNGGVGRFYPLHALPESVAIPTQLHLIKQRAIALDVAQYLPPEPKASALQARAAQLTADQQNLAHARLVVMKAFDAFARTQGCARKAAMPLFCEMYADGVLSIDPAIKRLVPPFSPSTLRNWQRGYKREGLVAIAGAKWGQHRKGTGQISNDAEIKEIIHAMLAGHPHCSSAHVMKALRTRLKATPDRVPSFHKVRRWIGAWKAENAQQFLAITNPDAWKSKYRAAAGDAAAHVSAPNAEWQLDSSPTDIILKDGKRYTLIGGVDVYTRRLKFHVTKTSSAAGVAALLRHTILSWGVPTRIKTDNGSDYAAKHIKLLCDELGIEQRFCTAYSPEQKPFIERAFKTFQHDVIELLPGYVGHNVAERQNIRARSSFADRLEGKAAAAAAISPDELQSVCGRWAENDYGRRPHDGLDGKSPFEVYTAWKGGIVRVENERALDILLLPAADGDGIRVVGKTGIKVAGALYNAGELGGLEGQRVFVRVDDSDLGRVFVFDTDKQFICIAEDLSISGYSASAVAAARRARQRQIINAARKEARTLTRKHTIENIGFDMLDHTDELAANITAFPKPAETHTTTGIEQAAIAAAAAEDAATPIAARKPAANDTPMTEEERAAWFGGAASVEMKRYRSKLLG